ncbi:hypothetical protein [Herbiconiux sp. VKM Ac-2851]|uniref:hypothetical protein n=1 Tax=Herbiconiux sp. VKM Ac-2851 TaxID=2739025 RepID=UPI001C20502D
MHEQLDDYERWKLVDYESFEPITLRPNANGKITSVMRLRSAMSNWFFEDRIAPAHGHGHAPAVGTGSSARGELEDPTGGNTHH